MSKDIASIREIQQNRQLIMQALNKNTTNFSNYAKISESLKEGNLKLTINPMTDEFLFQDNKNNTVCINPTKGLLNEKPINELLLKADVDNKADKEYVIEKVQEEHDRAEATYATKDDVVNKADKETVDMLAQTVSSHDRALMEDGQHLQKLDKDVSNNKWKVDYLNETVNGQKQEIIRMEGEISGKADKEHTHNISDVNYLQDNLDIMGRYIYNHTMKFDELEGDVASLEGASELYSRSIRELEKDTKNLDETKADKIETMSVKLENGIDLETENVYLEERATSDHGSKYTFKQENAIQATFTYFNGSYDNTKVMKKGETAIFGPDNFVYEILYEYKLFRTEMANKKVTKNLKLRGNFN
ncbi:hypothetical protein TVAG_414950 [Trichomonas vaginalis G3]|uniref:Uncharacterized protein n=1 Tax=Trichomonas vaginalis (strain ATCC PRA-98 / G3) TaxID=412133 RepID=A2FAH9_TRIV3|nr:phage tail repeat-like family [Trichomonas vaginalis G3]EAX98072.1 hypothetical protein TVAG_414950 [Trichomonas vaginalis G3]KAI5515650.1 phage tail repeat-like family [Trichomonas vaginalis G3]|eukprot:XP_001311002.1 hypothetical protein [Trichomonas vaginalis G3]